VNWSRWSHLEDFHYPADRLEMPPGCMDRRHVEMIHAVLVRERPPWIVEIGCWNGYSTAAIVEAWEQAPEIRRVDLVDTEIRDTVRKIAELPREHCKVRLCQMDSALYCGAPDCWIIDGDHQKGAFSNYDMAKWSGAQVIVAHDTHSALFMSAHEGAHIIGKQIVKEAAASFVDAAERPGEWTHRGLTIGFFRQPKPGTLEALEALAR
jgi:hypothetical protein